MTKTKTATPTVDGQGPADPTIRPLLYDEKGRPKRYLRFTERLAREEEIAGIERVLNDPDPAVRRRLENKGQVLQQLARSKRALENQSPPAVSGAVRDALVKRGRALERHLNATMLPHGEINVKLKDLSPNVRDYERRWQKQNKPTINEWKTIQVLLNRDSDEPNVANVERLRPAMPRGMPMSRAYLPARGYAPPLSAQGLANYDQIEWSPEDAQERAEHLAKAGVKVRKATAADVARPAPESTKGGDCRKCKRPFYGKGWAIARRNHERTCDGTEV